MSKLLVATRNPGKQRELSEMLAELGLDLVFPDDLGLYERAEEAGIEHAESFEGNARLKAQYFAKLARLPTLAEDSGIEVFTLGGAPGVHSRRFALPGGDPRDQDAANNAELLRRLAGAPAARRGARYRCVVAYLTRYDGVPHTFEGMCAGRILEGPRGSGGFGYDPLFFSDELEKAFGEATPEEKARVSHRGRAVRGFVEWYQTEGRVGSPP